jgi:uncharacterized damage-inducible protein DinB
VFSVFELYEYAATVRRKFVEKLATLPWSEVEKNREASFYSMKNIVLHMIDNEDWIVNYVIPGELHKYVRRKWSEYKSMDEVIAHLNEVEAKTRRFLFTLDDKTLSKKVTLKLQSGEQFELSVEECLFQSFTEQLYHMGELIALMWQINIEPPPMQWFYNTTKSNEFRLNTNFHANSVIVEFKKR